MKVTMDLEETYFTGLFDALSSTNSQTEKKILLASMPPEFRDDWKFIVECMNGKHKLGYKFVVMPPLDSYPYPEKVGFREYTRPLWEPINTHDFTELSVVKACSYCATHAKFIEPIVNRTLKIGIGTSYLESGDLRPMLAKTYDHTVKPAGNLEKIFITEKLDGNRCIATYDDVLEKWRFFSRNGNEKLNLNIDMYGFNTDYTYDGELVSQEQANTSIHVRNWVIGLSNTQPHYGNTMFNRTSGQANRIRPTMKFAYMIFDIIDSDPYEKRRQKLDSMAENKDYLFNKTTFILPVLSSFRADRYNPAVPIEIDRLLDRVTSCNGEGIMINYGNRPYNHSRCSDLVKYKKVQTGEFEVEGIEDGKGKYDGQVGALIVHGYVNDLEIMCRVGTGLNDMQRIHWTMYPEDILHKTVEVAYFDISQSEGTDNTGIFSLRFPRLKKVRDDKTENENF